MELSTQVSDVRSGASWKCPVASVTEAVRRGLLISKAPDSFSYCLTCACLEMSVDCAYSGWHGHRVRVGRGQAPDEPHKHGIDFADTVEVFHDDLACTMADPDHHAEQRFVVTGVDAFGRVLVVVYT